MSQCKKPCSTCPFNRANKATENRLGGSSWETFIGQVRGSFWLPCHNSKNYKGNNTPIGGAMECAGASIFRANIKAQVSSQLMQSEPDTELVFANEYEFIQEYFRKPDGSKYSIEHIFKSIAYGDSALDILTIIEKAKYAKKQGQYTSYEELTEINNALSFEGYFSSQIIE